MFNKKPIIISTDPGIDDAVAIAIALFNQTTNVKLICPISGNVSIDKTVYNTQRLLTFLNKPTQVVRGSCKPLLHEPKDASDIHGETGMDGFEFPDPTIPVITSVTAAQAMHKVVSQSTKKITIIGIGPLTDIALFLHQYPNDINNIEQLIIMGGALGRGNFGVLSEFNFGTDPEAAKLVFSKDLDIHVVPMEIGRQAKIMPETSRKIKTMGKVGNMFYSLFSKYRGGSLNGGLNMYDALAVALMLSPSIFKEVRTHVTIETCGDLTKGASLFDLKGYLNASDNVSVATNVDTKKFEDWFISAIRQTCN